MIFDTFHFSDNSNDAVEEIAGFMRLRFEYTTPNGFKRELLLAFADGLATAGLDKGLDALNLDGQLDDAYFVQEGYKLSIQALGAYKREATIPISLMATVQGTAKLKLLDIENSPVNMPVFLYDKQTGVYTDIRKEATEIEILQSGEIADRYEIRFSKKPIKSPLNSSSDATVQLLHPEGSESLLVSNPAYLNIKEIKVFDLTGRLLYYSQTGTQAQSVYELPVVTRLSGIGIVKLTLEGGETLIKKITVDKQVN